MWVVLVRERLKMKTSIPETYSRFSPLGVNSALVSSEAGGSDMCWALFSYYHTKKVKSCYV